MTKNAALFIIPAILLASLVIISPATATDSGCLSNGVPSVSTDKEGYAPSETVVITGQGFQCGVLLTVKVTRPDGSVVKGDGTFAPGSDTAVTDSTGAFTYNYQLNGITGKYLVDVIDTDGITLASTLFYDSHFRFGHLTWTKIGTNKARFKSVVGFRNYGSFSVGQSVQPTYIMFGDGTTVYPTYTVTFASGPDTNRDWFLAEATFDHQYSSAGPFIAADANCCRQIKLQHVNNPDGNWRVETKVDFNKADGSPVSSLPAIVDCVQNNANGCNFVVAAADPSPSTPMRWRLATPAEWAVPYQPGPPYAPNAAAVNPNTGLYTWNTTGATVRLPGQVFGGLVSDGTTLYSTQVILEDLDANGNVVTKSAIDFMIQLKQAIANTLPKFDVPPTPSSGTTLGVGVGQTLTFTVQASDNDGGDTVTLGAIGLPSGASFPIPAPGNPATSTFTWTPTSSQVGGYVVVFTAKDSKGGSAPVHSVAISVSSMSLIKSATHVSGPNPPEAGSNSFFDVFMQISLPAASPSAVTGINVVDSIGTKATFQGNLATDKGSITQSDGTINWNVGTLNPGQTATAQFRVSVTPTTADVGSPITLNTLATAIGTDSSSGLTLTAVSNTVETAAVILKQNQPPTANAGGPYSIAEGSSVVLTGSGSDPDGDPLTYSWDIDNDGSFETAGQNPTFSAVGRDGPSSQTVILKVCDNKGDCDTSSALVNINNAAPIITSVTNDGPINEGGSATVMVTAADPAGANDPLSYQFDCNNDGIFENGPQATNSASCGSADDGSFKINVRVTDDDGGLANDFTTMVVNNVAPTVNTGDDATINEGDTYSSSGSFSDPGDDTWTATVNYGDGSGDQPLMLNSDKSFSLSHTYTDNGVYTVTVTVTDDDTGTGSDTLQVTVKDIPIDVAPISVSNNLIQIGTSITATSTITGAPTDTGSATWKWDDGTSDTTAIASLPLGLSTPHTFSVPGVYTVSLTANDDDGNTDTESYQYVVVYDPNGGFVTGGGQIDSLAGAYIPDPSLTGRANFGFVSKYQKGATVPTGETEFQFQIADLNFHSTSYDWLVISGARAQYKGKGTINGKGNHGFLLTAVDGQVNGGGSIDKFRIKIWDIDTDSLVYDNAPGSDDIASSAVQAISGGSIVIHKK